MMVLFMIDFKEFQDKKKLQSTLNELNNIQNHLTTVIETLKPYIQYNVIMESISVLHNSRTLIEININKHKRMLNETKS